MFGSITNALNSLKDRSVEAALQALANRYVRPFGRVSRLTLDSAARTIAVEVELRGETTPVSMEARNYQLTREGDQIWIACAEFIASREWLTAALNEFVAGRKFRVPPAVGAVL